MKKTFCSLLAVIMILACTTVSAFASSPTTPAELDEGLVLNLGEPIATLAEDEGALLDGRITTRASGLPFSMTAKRVTGLLTTYNSPGKNFTGRAFDGLTGEGLLIKGTLKHTQGKKVKVGACYYIISSNTFSSVTNELFNSGVAGSLFTPKLDGKIMNFSNSITYYGHITNYSGTGHVSGTLKFSVSTK